jgi:hypothetical protein
MFNVLGAKLILKILRAPRFKKPYTLALPPPWSKVREYKTAIDARPALSAVTKAFAKYAHATAEKALADRMKIIGEVMKGKSFGGKKRVVYPRMTAAELSALIEKLKAM